MTGILNKAQAIAVMSAMAALNNVGGKLHATIKQDDGSTLTVQEEGGGKVFVLGKSDPHRVGNREAHADQNAFAAFYGV